MVLLIVLVSMQPLQTAFFPLMFASSRPTKLTH